MDEQITRLLKLREGYLFVAIASVDCAIAAPSNAMRLGFKCRCYQRTSSAEHNEALQFRTNAISCSTYARCHCFSERKLQNGPTESRRGIMQSV
jgi:hypothetical protein